MEKKSLEKISSLEEMSNFIFTSKYARYNDKLKRRETWEEAVDRVRDMHLKKFDNLSTENKDKIKWAFDLVKDKRVVPSMRSMQYGGLAVEKKNARIYNCSVRHVDSIRAFSEIFWLGMCGCGIGIGLSKQFLNRLPDLVNSEDKNGIVITYGVDDTAESWSDSIEALLSCYFKNTAFSGRKIVFDYSRIRRKGSRLKIGGGKAPGYKPLKAAHQRVKHLLDSLIEDHGINRLRSIDVCDIICHCSDAIISGGCRRVALSFIFDKDDDLMMSAKTGEWMKENPQRARGNNSVLLLRDDIKVEDFNNIIEKTKQFGEPGFIFANDSRQLLNPCFEISFIPETKDEVCGVQFCNLSSINGAKADSLDAFKECCEAASIIGTLQASYTDFPYLSKAAKEITEEESLLGVSITGLLDNPDVLLNPENQRIGAKICVQTNKEWAGILSISPCARTTCVKPEGSSSIVLMSSSGIHCHHSKKYFRRIQCNKIDNVYNFFKLYNPDFCEESVWSVNKTDDVVTFPIEISDNAIVKKDLNAIKHLELIKLTQQNWVEFGTTDTNRKNIKHSVSCTVDIEKDEWNDVVNYLFKNKDYFTAVSLFPASGDKDYKQAPNEDVVTEKDKKIFERMQRDFVHVDYSKLIENHDETDLISEGACYGGQCEVK